MAVFLAPFAAIGVGGAYVLSFSRAHSAAANISAHQIHGLKDAYPWPFWKPWFNSHITSNSTNSGKLASLVLFGLSYSVQKRLIWRHLTGNFGIAGSPQEKIRSTKEYIRHMAPGVLEFSANGLASCMLAGLVQPYIDGNNITQS